jgi:hypothetical protein
MTTMLTQSFFIVVCSVMLILPGIPSSGREEEEEERERE